MREFYFKHIFFIDKHIYDFKLMFYKIPNKNLYRIMIKFDSQIWKRGYTAINPDHYYLAFSSFLRISIDELSKNLIREFRCEVRNGILCFPPTELDKIIEWVESVSIMNKIVGE